MRAYTAPLLWALLILVLCGWPGDKLPEITFWQWLRWDKIAHLVLFGTQSFLWLRAAQSRKSQGLSTGFTVFIILTTIAYGGLVEILQDQIFRNRSGDIRDAIANALGALAGFYLFRRLFSSERAK